MQVNYQLRAATKLETIFLVSCGSLTDECLQPLRDLACLKSLTLKGGYHITSQSLVNLRGLENLTNLSLAGALNLQKAHLDGFQSLVVIDLSGCVSLVSVFFYPELPLRRLDLQGCTELTDEGLWTLHVLRKLQQVNFSGCSITDATLARLPAATMQASNSLQMSQYQG